MKCKIKGELRRLVVSKMGPFSRERWEMTPFELEISPGPNQPVADHLEFGLVEVADAWIIPGRIRSSSCVFGQIRKDAEQKWCNFNMVSIQKFEVRGRIELIEDVGSRSGDDKFAA